MRGESVSSRWVAHDFVAMIADVIFGYSFMEHTCTVHMKVVNEKCGEADHALIADPCLVGVFAIVFGYYVVAKENRAR